MKIKEVLLKEMGSRGAVPKKDQAAQPSQSFPIDDGGYDAMGNVTTGMPSASPTNVAAAAPKGGGGQAKWPTTDAEIRAFQKANKLKPDGMIGAKTMAALQKAGATPPPGFKPVGAKAPAAKPATNKPPAAPAAPAADPSIDPYDPNKDTNVQMTPQSDIARAEIDRMKQLAIGGQQGQAAQPATPVPDANTAADQATADQTQTSNYTGVDQRTANARDANAAPPVQGYAGQQAQVQQFGAPDPTPDQPNNQTSNYTGQDQRTANARDDGQAAQPRDASTVPPAALGQRTSPEVSADTGLSTVPGEVKTGTGGTTNLKTASQDEYAWRAKNPNWNMTGAQYPGAGNWDPKTGRSKKLQAQADANADAIKGFFNKINPFAKKEPAAPAPGPQNAQPVNVPPGFAESSRELDRIKKLSGIR